MRARCLAWAAGLGVVLFALSTVAQPNPPTPVFPANKAVFNRNNTSAITFSWSAVTGALEYKLNVFESGHSATPKFLGSVGGASQAVQVNGAWTPNVYVWEVQVQTSAGWSGWSSVNTPREFIVDIPAFPPTLSAPANGAAFEIGSAQSFSWTPTENVARYTYRLVRGTDLNATPLVHIEIGSTTRSTTFDDPSYDPGTHTWGVRGIKATPSGYDQSAYEATMGWGSYNTRTLALALTINVGAQASLSIAPTRTNPSTIYALPDLGEYGGIAPVETEKNFAATVRIVNNGSATVSLDDWGIGVTGGVATGFRVSHGSGMVLTPGQASQPFDHRGYITQNQLSGGGSTTYTAQVQYQVAGIWYDATGPGVSQAFTVYPRPALSNGMIIKRPRNELSTDTDHAIVYHTQNGKKWRGTETALGALHPGWTTDFYVYPVSTVTGLGTPSTPTSDSTIPEMTGRNFLYLSGMEAYIVEPEPGQSTPLRSRRFDDEAAFYSYGYDSTVLNTEVFAASSSQVSWLQNQYPVGSDIVVALPLALQSPPNGTTITSAEVTFSWTNAGAVAYELWVDDDMDFSSPDVSPANVNGITVPQKNIEANWLAAGTYYWRVVARMPDLSSQTSPAWTFTLAPPTLASPAWAPLYRLYSPTGRDHFYCSNEAHQAGAMGQGYNDEGVEGHICYSPFDDASMVRIYRLWDGVHGCHYYTTDPVDKDQAIANRGHLYEGVTGYAIGVPRPGLVPLYHLQKDYSDGSSDRDNFYTVSEYERQNAADAFGFTDMGVTAYVSLSGGMGLLPWNPLDMVVGVGVGAGNGNFQHHATTGLSIPNTGIPLTFSHVYNSLGVYYPRHIRPMGAGWSHTYDAHIAAAGGYLYVHWGDGRLDVYNQNTRQSVIKGVYDQMTVVSSDEISIKTKDQTRFRFVRLAPGYPLMLKEISDRNGNTLTCIYEDSGRRRLVVVAGAAGRVLTLTYGSASGTEGLIQRVTDPAGRQVNFMYDANNNLVSYTDPVGQVTQYVYRAGATNEHQLERIQLPDGTAVDNTYANRKLATQHWDGSSGGISLAYTGNSTDISFLDGSRSVSIGYGSPVDPNQPRTPRSVTSGSDSTIYMYDNPAHPTLPSAIRDPKGNYHNFSYDAAGNVTQSSEPEAVAHRYTYDGWNNITSHADPNGHVTSYGYDATGNLTSITQPEGHVTTIVRLFNGLAASVTTYAGTTQYSHDAYGDMTGATDPLSHTATMTYDIVGRLLTTTNAKQQTTTYAHNARGQVTQVQDAASGVLRMGYSLNGDLASVSGPGPATTTWTYTSGFLTGFAPPGAPETYALNADGTLEARTRALGVTSYNYDAAGRLTGITGDANTLLSRDANGNVTQVTDPSCNLLFTYDAMNRITAATDRWGKTVGYQYDQAGNVTRIVYEPGKAVNYTYDRDNRLRTVTDFAGRVTSYSYRLDGLLTRVDNPNGTWTIYGYDAAGHMVSLQNEGPSGVIAGYAFGLDPLGNRLSEMATETLPPPALSPGTTSYIYNAADQLLTAGSDTYTYDGNGNVRSVTGTINRSLTFDRDNRLLSVTGDINTSYIYDVFGNRRSATRSGVETRYVLDVVRGLQSVLYETDSAGNALCYYVYGLGLISRIAPNGTAEYFAFDAQGSAVAVTSSAGTVIAARRYSPFGSLLQSADGTSDAVGFLGQFGVLGEAGDLLYVRARYYSTSTGRFLSADPSWNTNLYAYAGGNPITFFDADGRARSRYRQTAWNLWQRTRQTIVEEATGAVVGELGAWMLGNSDKVVGAGLVRANVWAPTVSHLRYQWNLWRAPGQDNWQKAEQSIFDATLFGVTGVINFFAPGSGVFLDISTDLRREDIYNAMRDGWQWDWLTNAFVPFFR